jgi:hypothetical protein
MAFVSLTQAGEVGRYQLLAVDDNGHKTIFKIDTTTGQTWKYWKDPDHKPSDNFDSYWIGIAN